MGQKTKITLKAKSSNLQSFKIVAGGILTPVLDDLFAPPGPLLLSLPSFLPLGA